MTLTAGIFFSYSSQADTDYILDKLSIMKLDKIVLAIGGDVSVVGMENDQYKGVELRFEKERLGKVESLNRALEGLNSDITFLVSGDVRFDPYVFQQLSTYFDENVGMVIPRVVPFPSSSFAGRVSAVMWMIHDITLENAYEASKYFCGGEMQAVKHPAPIVSPEIVNDDEFLCHQVYSSGRKIVYAREVEVVNYMPGNFKQLLKQRIRINFGHLQSKKMNKWHSSISMNGFSDVKESIGILLKFNKRHRRLTFLLMVSFLIEVLSIVIAMIQKLRGQSYRYWQLKTNEE